MAMFCLSEGCLTRKTLLSYGLFRFRWVHQKRHTTHTRTLTGNETRGLIIVDAQSQCMIDTRDAASWLVFLSFSRPLNCFFTLKPENSETTAGAAAVRFSRKRAACWRLGGVYRV